ncbi:hypothetical protein [Pseudomonas sp. NPDC089734]|uniref:gp53-like domain-containing protein n=1 Tax=Pseudomonas sp. NPDC089734 TaxID=3364469 RepID=UPI00381BA880
MDYPKSVPSVGLVNGKFVDENTVSGAPGSLISASWGNAVTDELLAVIRAAQLDPKEDDLDQLLEAIRYIVQDDAYAKARVYNKEEIDALLDSNSAPAVVHATSSKEGIARFGTMAEQVGGVLDSVISHPLGVVTLLNSWFSKRTFSANDYIRIPDVDGGLIIQWGYVWKPSSDPVAVTWPVAFPKFFCRCIASVGGASIPLNAVSTGTPSQTGATFYSNSGGTGWDISYIVIGW